MNVKWTVVLTVLSFVAVVTAQDVNCDFYQYVRLAVSYVVRSPRYPANYTDRLQCRWTADCPTGYNCQLTCADIAIPQSDGCTIDRLLISKSGDTQLTGADWYCGPGTLSATSTGQRISIGLITSGYPPGGRFSCDLVAQPVQQTTQCTCGERRQNRIVGGTPTGVNEYKMMVGLARDLKDLIGCGAVIISPYHVLTAAHCLVRETVADTAAIVGEHDVTADESPATRAYRALSFIIHPQFSQANFDYDIAIINVDGPIEFNDRVGPVCLPFKFVNENFAREKVTVLGWGTIDFGGPRSKVLLKADLDVISQAQCQRSFTNLTDRQMCTYTPGKDTCQYDSGGPALYTDPSTGLLFNVGIVSSGRSCATTDPGVYARVTTLLRWIQANTEYSYCVK